MKWARIDIKEQAFDMNLETLTTCGKASNHHTGPVCCGLRGPGEDEKPDRRRPPPIIITGSRCSGIILPLLALTAGKNLAWVCQITATMPKIIPTSNPRKGKELRPKGQWRISTNAIG